MTGNFITPGSRVRIISGSGRGTQRTVMRMRGAYVVLKDYLRDTLYKRLYNVKIHVSNVVVINRNCKERKK